MLKAKGAVGRRLREDNSHLSSKNVFRYSAIFKPSWYFCQKHLLSKFFKTGFDAIEIQNSFTVQLPDKVNIKHLFGII